MGAVKVFADEIAENQQTVVEEAVQEVQQEEVKQEEVKEEVVEEKQEEVPDTEVKEEVKKEVVEESQKQEETVVTEDKLNENKQEEVLEVQAGEIATRTLTANVDVQNSNYGNVNLPNNKITLNTTFEKGKWTWKVKEQDQSVRFNVTPKSGYQWSLNPNKLALNVSIENGLPLVKYGESKTVTVNPLGTVGILPSNIEDTIQIDFEPKAEENREEIIISNNGNGTVSPKGGNLYFHEVNKTYIDKGSKHTFVLTPEAGKKVGQVTLNGVPQQVINNEVTVGAGNLHVEFIEDTPTVEKRDLEVDIQGNGSITIANQKIDTDQTIEINKEEQLFLVEAENGYYIETVKLNDTELIGANGVYTIPATFDGGKLEVVFAKNIDTRIELESLKVPYTGSAQELQYKVVGADGKVLLENQKVEFKGKDILGRPITIHPKDVGTYDFTVNFNGEDKYNATSINGVFEITKFKPKVNVANTTAKYTGNSIKTPVTVTHNAGYISIYTGVNINAQGIVSIDSNLGNSIVDGIINGAIELGGGTIGGFKEALKKSEALLEGILGIELDDILAALDYIPNNLKVQGGGAKEAGAYVATAIVLDKNAEIGVGVGSLLITRNQKKVVFTENSLPDRGIVHVEPNNEHVQKYTHEAVFEGTTDTSRIKIMYSGIMADGKAYHSKNKPSKPGVYIATAYSYKDPEYTMALAARSFTIVKGHIDVVFTEDSLANNAVVKVDSEYKHQAYYEGTNNETLIRYSGITDKGKIYLSEKKPTEEGRYIAAAYSYNDPDFTLSLATRCFSIAKFDTKIDITAEDKTYDGQPYNAESLVHDTAGDLVTDASIAYKYYQGDVELDSAPTQVGDYKVVATYSGDNANNSSTSEKEFSIVKANLTINIDNVSKVEFEKDPKLTHTIGGLVNGDAIDFELVRTEGEAPGTYEITVVDKELENYSYTVKVGKLTIEHKLASEGEGPIGPVMPEVDDPAAEGEGPIGPVMPEVDDPAAEGEGPEGPVMPEVDDPAAEGEGPEGPVMPQVKPDTDNPKTGDTGVLGYAGIGLASLLGVIANRRKRK